MPGFTSDMGAWQRALRSEDLAGTPVPRRCAGLDGELA
jgi:hypothetical protein